MGKNSEGKLHSPEEKKSLEAQTENLRQEIKDEGTSNRTYSDNEELAENMRIRHPNRNTDKQEDQLSESRETSRAHNSRHGTTVSNAVAPEELSGVFSKEIFIKLADYMSDCCISVYLPTHRSGVEVNEQQDAIAFKNILQKLAAQLKQKGKDPGFVGRLLEPGYVLLNDEKLWYNMSEGLAVFIAEDFFKYARMPVVPVEKTLINTSFYLSPFISLIAYQKYFYLLVISKKQARFYKVDDLGMENIPIDELPNGIADVVHLEEKGDQKLFRTESYRSGEGTSPHGMGAGRPDDKKNIALYLEEVDDTLWKAILHKEHAPLLLAGVEYLLPIYKSVTDYKFVWEDVITGNMDYADQDSLYQKARQLMMPYFEQELHQALSMYHNRSATALTSIIPADVIPAAYYGRVSNLFVRKNEHIWGTFDDFTNELKIHEKQEEGDECLLDKAVIKTIMNGGDVFVLEKDRMPADSEMAGVLRY